MSEVFPAPRETDCAYGCCLAGDVGVSSEVSWVHPDVELAVILARPRGPHPPEGDPGMVDLWGQPARCTRCGWEGVPTSVGGDSTHECPRCEGAPEVDELLAACGGDYRHTVAKPYRPRKQTKGASGAAWRARGVIVGRQRVAEHADIGRNDPCYCGSGKKFKKCHG